MKGRLPYYLLRLAVGLLAHLPWWLIHVLSRALAWLMAHLVRYRRRVIRENLRNSFPERSEAEQRQIEWDFYLQFAYNFLSTPRLLRLPPEVIMRQHFLIPDLTPLQEAVRDHRCAFACLGHLGNWELFSTGQLYFDQIGVTMDQVYRRLEDQAMDELFAEQRRRFGALLTPKTLVVRSLAEHLREETDRRYLMAMITDQAPGVDHANYFTDFLHQPTAMLDGVERLARRYDLPVLYFDIERAGPMRFIGHFHLITSTPRELPEGEITERYARLLEATIRRDPALWLWSHKRWKRRLEHYPHATLSPSLRAMLEQ